MDNACSAVELLRQKLELAREIYENTVVQSAVLTEKDYNSLNGLLAERQKYIDRFAALDKLCKENQEENTEESAELKHLIKSKMEEVFKQSSANIENARKLQSQWSESIRHIKTGETALKKGYYRQIPQQYGYFFDKKVGK